MAMQSRNAVEANLYSNARNRGQSAPAPLIFPQPREATAAPEKGTYIWVESATKRNFDLVAASMGLVVLLPLLGAIAVCVKLTSRGPILFRQERIGKDQRLFTIYKYRTMHVLSEEQGPSVTRSCDHRMTKVGRLLRKFKLDELPQLYNVIRGDMSLVGPRPKLEKHERMQMTCKPGITGAATIVFAREQALLAQVPEDSFEDFTINVLNTIKAQIDTDYAKKSTFRSDMELLVTTLAGSKRRKPISDLSELLKTYEISSLSQ